VRHRTDHARAGNDDQRMRSAKIYLLAAAMAGLLAAPFTRSAADGAVDVRPAPFVKKTVRHHCKQCGVVVSTTHVGAAGGEPAYFEFVVRMHDGSMRTSRVANLYGWKPGDRVMFGGGRIVR
jgi:hypothetical protein